jgi:dienelactone hydrolase
LRKHSELGRSVQPTSPPCKGIPGGGTQHAFNNDTGAARYNKAAAELAWGRTLAFFKEQLGAPPKAA